MIFVTVGAQMAFDRLIRAVDAWAGVHPAVSVFGQIGPSAYHPAHMGYARFLEPREFEARFAAAQLVIAHAGMGTIITALELDKPLVVVPRRGDLAETRNDHQLATARRFGGLGFVQVAHDVAELTAHLDRGDYLPARATKAPCTCAGRADDCPFADMLSCVGRRPGMACGHLLAGLHTFIIDGALPPPERGAAAAAHAGTA